MQVISGQNIDLLVPFPVGEARRAFGWSHCYRTLVNSDQVPTDQDAFIKTAEHYVNTYPSAGVIDKNQLTNQRHEAPLVGMLFFEVTTTHSGFVHFICGRKAFKAGLIEEAIDKYTEYLFGAFPELLRIGAYVEDANSPAKGLLRRLGFRFEGVFEDWIVKDSVPKNVVYFGLTRRRWALSRPAPVEAVPSDEEMAYADGRSE